MTDGPRPTLRGEGVISGEWENDDLEGLAGELRIGPGAELRAEAQELERLSAMARLRRRSLAQAAREALHRGDRVILVAGSHRFSGTLVSVGRDYLTLETPERLVDARLEAVATFIEPSTSGGGESWPGATTLKARLSELEGVSVELVCLQLATGVTGRITAVAVDHVLIEDGDGREWFLPLATVTLVIRWRDGAQG